MVPYASCCISVANIYSHGFQVVMWEAVWACVLYYVVTEPNELFFCISNSYLDSDLGFAKKWQDIFWLLRCWIATNNSKVGLLKECFSFMSM